MGTVKMRLMFCLSIFGLRWLLVTMSTFHLTKGRYNPHFDLNSLIFILSFGESFSYFATYWK